VNLRPVSLAVVVVLALALQACTKTVYYAVLAPHEAMEDQHSCFRQCQMLHAGKTKEFLLCLDTCPDARVERDTQCNQVQFDRESYGCTTMQNKTFDGVSFGIGIGSLIILINVILLWAYTLSCHSCRHITGGRLKHFSKHPVRYWTWTQISKLNKHHMAFAWISLATLMLSDLYIMLVASGAFSDPRIFN